MTFRKPALIRGLIVSCQPVSRGPMDSLDTIVRLALAARDGGAQGLRIEGRENVAAVTAACSLPVIGLIKRDLETSPVRITPFVEDVEALVDAGAAVIAVDATARARPVPADRLLHAIHAHGRIAMADVATFQEAQEAASMGFDILGTTLSGYTGGPVPEAPDLDLVAACATLGKPVVAEGRYNSPDLARKAIVHRADAVCVGSAITRTEHVTGWFADTIAQAARVDAETVLAFDIGGTKTLAALVRGRTILEKQAVPTDRNVGTDPWMESLALLAAAWEGAYDRVGAAVTGLVHDGHWFALNPDTLPIPEAFPLTEELTKRFKCPVAICNDAQAAAWGEYVYGAGERQDMIFLTISSGIGGGIISGGRLMIGARGLAGSLGQTLWPPSGERLETLASGFGMSRTASAIGRPADAKQIFEAAERGEEWANSIVQGAVEKLTVSLANLQALIDPERIVLGGGVGRAPAFHTLLSPALLQVGERMRPRLVPARLAVDSGVLGISDIARHEWPIERR
ncbi:putative N-acetylmannosamine-6-phosphate 2-epimerase [Microvirga calopogonii]|uniref:putative N-acetylmannosamine-6-phosphate 2-epimerase n=1 Tax=Microvirga calopogonii TaxID=2078013 RepID=UPI000E0D4283|nr:putative N-acetylmannosamine-6-phosphate 2-epimerase [Microvirga calopogonii]